MTKCSPPPLTDAENARWYSKFFYERYRPDADALAELGENAPMGLENASSVEDRFRILSKGDLPRERGWQAMPDQTTFVCGKVFMKNVTPEMFQWWFSWMPADPLRGRLWDPEEHLAMIVDEATLHRITDPALTVKDRLYGNILYAVEDNGTGYESDRYSYKKLKFFDPVEFGLTREQLTAMEAEGGRLVTAMSGPKDGDFVSSFLHYARPVPGGCEVRSWFFVGHKLAVSEGGPLRTMEADIPQAALEQIGRGLSMHCLKEYTNLGYILPEVYEKQHDIVDSWEMCKNEFGTQTM
ncbi:DAPG hydrolase family protein [uncultured Oscillibacter sp.]|uniref:DAPG hydrolase family protein n=1 Tax=uncultured Oscillibacter sp. TaxID=876091 RepID=UPI00280558C8|nr:hypothetical protein [uncultured Oscillibacter sp.]